MIALFLRQSAALLLTASSFLRSLLRAIITTFRSPPSPQTVPNETELQMTPRPNPKYAKKISEVADKALAEGHIDEALHYYQQAARYAPQDTALIERIVSMRSKLVRDHVDAAERDALVGHADVATEELAKALLIDPSNTIVTERLIQMKAMKDEPPRLTRKLRACQN